MDVQQFVNLKIRPTVKGMLLIMIMLLVPFSLLAADLPLAKPESVGMSKERLSRIAPAMDKYIINNLVPGTVTLVARKGKVVYFEAQGYKDAENKKPMTIDTIFRLASMTKPITSVALMMLYEEGRFSLSDPVAKWIPEFANPVVRKASPNNTYATQFITEPAKRPITVLHLLTHTAGLSNNYRGLTIPEYLESQKRLKPDETVGDMIKRYAKVPLNYHPGEAWEYSRATCVVGRLVEIFSGMTLDEFFKKRIFEPLDMKDTYFFLPLNKLDRFANAYKPGEKGKIALLEAATPDSIYVKEPHVYFMGSGGLVGTASDYFKFSQMLLNGGQYNGVRLLSRKTIEFMTKNHVGDLELWLPGPYERFGLGFGVARDINTVKTGLITNHPGPVPWSPGSYYWGGAYCTFFWVDPVEQLIGMVFTQVIPYAHINIRHEFVGLATQAIVD
jgi:CubicO group peptidase (beta-lactamase class C family)